MQSRRNSHARLLNADHTKYPSFRPENGPPKSMVRTQKTFESGPENFHTPVVNLDLKQYAITAQFPRSPAECRSNKISNIFGLEGRTWHIDWLGPVEVRRLCVCLSDGIGWVIRLIHMSDGSHYSQWRINVTHHPTTATTVVPTIQFWSCSRGILSCFSVWIASLGRNISVVCL